MINSFQPIATTVQSITTSVALVTPQTNVGYQPLNTTGQVPNANAVNPPALLFHTEGENAVRVHSDITDHFTEINSAIQDQISLPPEKITVHGFIGELNDVFPVAVPNNGQISAILPNVASFVPQFTAAGQAAINTAAAAYQTAQAVANAAVSAWGSLSGAGSNTVIGSSGISSVGSSQGLQQQVFQQFYLYWRTRTLFTVQTPWAVLTNMAIEEMSATQDEDTRMITDFYISFKMLRFSSTTEITLKPQAVSRTAQQQDSGVNIGTSTGVKTTVIVQDLQSNITSTPGSN